MLVKRKRMLGAAVMMLLAGVSAAPALACTRPMAVAEMADYSAQVLTVRVESVRSAWAEKPRRIETSLTFVIEEALKGQRTKGERMTITAPGGTVDGWSMRMCCAPQFVAGETYVVFLLPEYRTHPVVGMSRGAFHLVMDAAGTRRVMSVTGEALVGIGGDGMPVMVRSQGQGQQPVFASGVRVVDVPRVEVMARAMTYEGLRAELAPVLEASRAFPVGGPVAQRVQVDYLPVAMVAARGAAGGPAQARGDQQQVPVATAPPRSNAPGVADGGGQQ